MTVTVTTDRQLLRQTLIGWLSTYTGIPAERIIYANQATPRPAKPYATILFPTMNVKTGFDESDASFNASTQLIERTTHGPRTFTAQVEVFTDVASTPHADEAAELLENALLALDTVAVRDAFQAAKLGMFGHTSVNRLDEQFGERWERRAQADVSLCYSGETFDDGGQGSGDWIKTVDFAVNT